MRRSLQPNSTGLELSFALDFVLGFTLDFVLGLALGLALGFALSFAREAEPGDGALASRDLAPLLPVPALVRVELLFVHRFAFAFFLGGAWRLSLQELACV